MADERDTKPIEIQMAEEVARVFKHFAPGGKLGPLEPAEYEKMQESLPPLERELNKEVTNFVQMVDYFGRQGIKLGPDVADAMSAAAKLPVEERTARIHEINQRLMKRLSDAGQSAPFRM
jgi:hypothetical protein